MNNKLYSCNNCGTIKQDEDTPAIECPNCGMKTWELVWEGVINGTDLNKFLHD